MSITIYTPTFNRAYILSALYKSLVSQTNKNFNWLIIDDGSTDETQHLIITWKNEKKIQIESIYQKNMGMVAAHNTALENISTELAVCIDSDDFMPADAVGKILKTWEDNASDNNMGLVGLDIYKNGKVIGDSFPSNLMQLTFSELKHKYKIKGDKKYVLRTDLAKKALPYPYIEGEKFPAPSYLYLLLEKNYKFIVLNEPLCVVEYLADGNSMNKLKQYRESPNAFALYRLATMEHAYNYKDRFRQAIHYVSSKMLGNKKRILKDTKYKLSVLFAMPFGFLLFLYIKHTKSNTANSRLNK